MLEALTQIGSRVQHTGSKNHVKLMRVKALRLGILLDIEDLIPDKGIRPKSLFEL